MGMDCRMEPKASDRRILELEDFNGRILRSLLKYFLRGG